MRSRLRSFILPALLLGMQACWLYTWVYVLEMRLLQQHSIAAAAVLLAAIALPVQLLLERLPLRKVPRLVSFWFIWIGCAAVAGKLLLFPHTGWADPGWTYALPQAVGRLLWEEPIAELLLLFGSCAAWYVGGRAADQQVTYETLLAQFQFGLVLLFAAFLLAHAFDLSTTHPALLSVIFFSLSLTALAITRNRQANERGALPRGRHFTGSLVALLITVSALGLIAGIAITPDLVGIILDAVRFVGHALASGLAFLLSLLPAPDMPSGEELGPPATGDDSALREFYQVLPWPAILRRILYILWVVVTLGMLLFALWRLCSMILDWLRRRGDASGVEIESLDSGLLADLLSLLLWLDRNLRRAFNQALAFVRARLGNRIEPTWLSVYSGLSRWAAKKVLPRAPWQSIHEYQAALATRLPTATQELAFVTETYARARYGRIDPERTTVEAMQHAVSRIRRAPRRKVVPAGNQNKTEGET